MVKRAFISGATKGIGKAIAVQFAKEGFDLFITARNSDELARLKNDLESQFSIQVDYYPADFSQAESVSNLCKNIINKNISFSILVNNTGIYTLNNILDKSEDLKDVLQVNLLSHQAITSELVPFLQANHSHIFNVGSIVSKQIRTEAAFYTISKQAFAAWTKLLFETLRKKAIKVTHVIPSGTYTASWNNAPVDSSQLLQPEDIAKAIWNAYQTSENTVIEEIVLRKNIELSE